MKHVILSFIIGFVLLGVQVAQGKVIGPCGDCHTMHNSQNDASMSYLDSSGSTFIAANPAAGDGGPNGSLLRYGCVGCHTGTNSGGTIPFVFGPVSAIYGTNTLAGGDFRWVVGDSTTGHNVIGLPGIGSETMNAPGGSMAPDTLTCAGTNGCHGNGFGDVLADEFGSIAGGHHGSGGVLLSDTTKRYVPGDTTDMSNTFRMLSNIKGIEDDNWEYGAGVADDGTTDHNQYFGIARSGVGGELTDTTGSISSLCAKCHGDFHSGSGEIGTNGMSSPWVRHPIDFDMATASGSEYAYYNGGVDGLTAPYSLIAPVASDTITGADADLLSTVKVASSNADGSAIVTCISCHRAHGSEYPDLLRWDYVNMIDSHSVAAGNNNTGCFICHTTKDDV